MIGHRAARTVGAAATCVAVLLSAACGGVTSLPVPLRPEPLPWADTLPIPEPAARDPIEIPKIMDDALAGEVSRVVSIRSAVGMQHEALNLTRFDDVVPSAWFEHRNATRPLTPQQVRDGPTTGSGPDTTGALQIISAKVQGVSPGFNIRDARGDRYVVKFDPRGFPHMSSSAGVISNRLLHAAGYHVPEDFVFVFSKSKLEVAEGATIRGEDFEERPLTLKLAFDVLEMTDSLPDGRYLAVTSKFVPGPTKGPFFFDGIREDDPNDWYHHEHRRELRGLYVVSSWLNHVDMRWMNTMDAYVPPGYLKHYLIDFAASLGSGTTRPHEPREGSEYNVDLWASLARVFTLGFYDVGWEDREWEVIDPTIGWLDGEKFDPGGWKPNWPNRAFQLATDRDGYWGAKLVGSFSDEQIRAAVEAGRLPGRPAADTLAAILITRRDRVVDHWFRKVSPLEDFVVVTSAEARPESTPELEIRFEDLGLEAGLWKPEDVSYRWELEHPELDRDWQGTAVPRPDGSTPRIRLTHARSDEDGSPGALPPDGGKELARLEVSVEHARDGARHPPVTVWLEWDGSTDSYRVAGLEH